MISSIEDKIEQAESNLQRNLDWVGKHDTRIAFVAGISIAMLGVLANASALITVWKWYTYLVFIFTALLLFTSLVLIYFSQYPKTESRNSSLIFFGTIATLKCDEFKKKFKEINKENYLDDILCQIHINAEIISKKFAYLKSSLILLAISIIPWLIAIYLSKLYIK
jgi:membrane-associated HD superfamily phosphohydrolase